MQIREQTQQAAARGDAAVTPLADLELVPFLDKDGKLTKVDTKGAKASVYAVYDEVKRSHDHTISARRKPFAVLPVFFSDVPLCQFMHC